MKKSRNDLEIGPAKKMGRGIVSFLGKQCSESIDLLLFPKPRKAKL